MKTLKYIAGVLALCGMSYSLCAQQSDAHDNTQLPASQQGMYGTQRAPYEDLEGENVRKINRDDIPKSVQKTLQGNEWYNGWADGTFYFDEEDDQYIVYIPDGRRIYRFAKNGRAVPIMGKGTADD